MKKTLGILLFSIAFLSTTYAIGQIYNDRHEIMTDPLDRAAEQHAATYADVPAVAEAEDSIPQEERYLNMTDPMNAANDEHFNIAADQNTVLESIAAEQK
jgi:hypothetical protein